ncbi:hypothetical protein DFH06DRAFT_1337137 [Mycena polygramma]|nr:hypothetical protein DFH06DRAFT_1337137 [Mycena polygramma]
MSFELPPELWLRIFNYLPWPTIPLIHQVSRSFAALSYWLLFEKFIFQPRPQFIKKSAATLAPTDIERLAFWTSDKMSTQVRHCIVVVKIASKAPVVDFRVDGPSPFISAIVHAFSRFSNLQHLTFMNPGGGVEIPGLRLDCLPCLRSLEIAAIHLTRPTQPATVLKLELFSFSQCPPSWPIVPSTQKPPLSALDPAALRHLKLYLLSIDDLANPAALGSFTNLHVFDLHFLEATVPALRACISPLSALRELKIILADKMDVGEEPVTEAPLTLSHLHTYTGPAALLQLILPRATPLRLTLQHSMDYAPDMLAALHNSGFDAYPSVKKLSFQVQCQDIDSPTLLPAILVRLPRLCSLSMNIRCHCASSDGLHEDWDTPALSAQLTRILGGASTLETLELRWQSNAGMEGVVYSPVADKPRVEDVQSALFAAIPTLRTVSSQVL